MHDVYLYRPSAQAGTDLGVAGASLAGKGDIFKMSLQGECVGKCTKTV